ncbi:AlpA family phage regulatory protein [Bordetella sp. 15P40C-2]|uniref:helix-turn-helix transcriptional regulator n=1 Tax=Bordetella sp. 15P40C-2 TaxID=2572246 RepID=UPI001321AEE0|nr:AlpA family phage regulatory protein [Bordetella sp. 15P40C-2]
MEMDLDKLACLDHGRVLDLTSLSKSTLSRLVRAGQFPSPKKFKSVNKRYWAAEEVYEWLQNQRS